jgi:DNA-directed RNA polymerase specialized sigma24 family protein
MKYLPLPASSESGFINAGNAVRTYEEVAAIMGVSKSRVQQIEASAMHKLRRALAPKLGYSDAAPPAPYVGRRLA